MKKGFVFLLVGILLIGLSLFLITAYLIGWDIFGWMGSKQAILIYLLVAILGITCVVYYWKGKE